MIPEPKDASMTASEKPQVGDIVHVRGTVVSLAGNGGLNVEFLRTNGVADCTWSEIAPSAIVHIEAHWTKAHRAELRERYRATPDVINLIAEVERLSSPAEDVAGLVERLRARANVMRKEFGSSDPDVRAYTEAADALARLSSPPADVLAAVRRAHKWVPSTLGHGESMCVYCKMTNREAAALGVMNECDSAPIPGAGDAPLQGAVERLDPPLTEATGGPNHSADVLAAVRCSVMTMQTSAGPDHYVHLQLGDREITPHVFKTKGRAEYETAEWKWFFGQGEKPDILAFDTEPDSRPLPAPSEADGWQAEAEKERQALGDQHEGIGSVGKGE